MKKDQILLFLIDNSDIYISNIYKFNSNDEILNYLRKEMIDLFNLTYEEVCIILDKEELLKTEPIASLYFKKGDKNEKNSLH